MNLSRATRIGRLGAVALALVIALALQGCGTAAMNADDPVFGGLPNATVQEALRNGDFLASLKEEPRQSRPGLAQGMVINFIVCRDAYRAYRVWDNVGAPPKLAPLPTPANPQRRSYAEWKRDYANLEARVRSGNMAQLWDYLTGEGRCGDWIPVREGAATIEVEMYRAKLEKLGVDVGATSCVKKSPNAPCPSRNSPEYQP